MAPRTHVICALVFGIVALGVVIAMMLAERWEAITTGQGVLPPLLAFFGIVALLVIAGRAFEALRACERMRAGSGTAHAEGGGRRG